MDGWRMLRDVYNVLNGAGFQIQIGGPGLTVEELPDGVRVLWRPDLTRLRPATGFGLAGARNTQNSDYGEGIRQAMIAAVTSVLEQAGYHVHALDEGLMIAAVVGDAQPRTTQQGLGPLPTVPNCRD